MKADYSTLSNYKVAGNFHQDREFFDAVAEFVKNNSNPKEQRVEMIKKYDMAMGYETPEAKPDEMIKDFITSLDESKSDNRLNEAMKNTKSIIPSVMSNELYNLSEAVDPKSVKPGDKLSIDHKKWGKINVIVTKVAGDMVYWKDPVRNIMGGVKATSDMVSGELAKGRPKTSLKESSDVYEIEVSLKYAQQADGVYNDIKRNLKKTKQTSTNSWVVSDEDEYNDFVESLKSGGIPASEIEVNGDTLNEGKKPNERVEIKHTTPDEKLGWSVFVDGKRKDMGLSQEQAEIRMQKEIDKLGSTINEALTSDEQSVIDDWQSLVDGGDYSKQEAMTEILNMYDGESLTPNVIKKLNALVSGINESYEHDKLFIDWYQQNYKDSEIFTYDKKTKELVIFGKNGNEIDRISFQNLQKEIPGFPDDPGEIYFFGESKMKIGEDNTIGELDANNTNDRNTEDMALRLAQMSGAPNERVMYALENGDIDDLIEITGKSKEEILEACPELKDNTNESDDTTVDKLDKHVKDMLINIINDIDSKIPKEVYDKIGDIKINGKTGDVYTDSDVIDLIVKASGWDVNDVVDYISDELRANGLFESTNKNIDIEADDILVDGNGREFTVRTVEKDGITIRDEKGKDIFISWENANGFEKAPINEEMSWDDLSTSIGLSAKEESKMMDLVNTSKNNKELIDAINKEFSTDKAKKLVDYYTKNPLNEAVIDKSKFEPIGVVMKDYKESWDTKELNNAAKGVPGGSWHDVNTGSDADAMVYTNNNFILSIADDAIDFMTLGEPYYDSQKKDLIVIALDKSGNEISAYWNKGKGFDELWNKLDENKINEADNAEDLLKKMNDMVKSKYGKDYLTISHDKASKEIDGYKELYDKYKSLNEESSNDIDSDISKIKNPKVSDILKKQTPNEYEKMANFLLNKGYTGIEDLEHKILVNFSNSNENDLNHGDMGTDGEEGEEKILPDGGDADDAEYEKYRPDVEKFLAENPNPADEQVHAFATELGIEKDDVEEIIYKIAGEKVTEGFGNTAYVNDFSYPEKIKRVIIDTINSNFNVDSVAMDSAAKEIGDISVDIDSGKVESNDALSEMADLLGLKEKDLQKVLSTALGRNSSILECIIVNEDLDAGEIAEIMTVTNQNDIEVSAKQITPEIITAFNNKWNELKKKYPKYDPFNSEGEGGALDMNVDITNEFISQIK